MEAIFLSASMRLLSSLRIRLVVFPSFVAIDFLSAGNVLTFIIEMDAKSRVIRKLNIRRILPSSDFPAVTTSSSVRIAENKRHRRGLPVLNMRFETVINNSVEALS